MITKFTAKKLAGPTAAMVFGLSVIAATPAAFAQSPTQIKQHNAWGAFSHQGTDGKVCYVLSIPTEKIPADVDHGDIFFMLAQHPGQNVRLEPQFTAGYVFQDSSKVVLDIDGKKFSMFTRGQNAWLENPAEEAAVVEAMKAGAKMSVSATSRRGTQTSYAYSLSGVTASIGDITDCK
jgi:invasion protein IalB